MQVDVFIIETGVDATILQPGIDVTTGDGMDVTVVESQVEAPSGEVLDCVTGMDGARGRPARADVTLSWAGRLRAGEELPGVPITFPTRFTDEASWGYARTPATADRVLTICNRSPATVIGTVTWAAGQREPIIALAGGAYSAQREDFLFLVGPITADLTLADAGVTLAGETVQ